MNRLRVLRPALILFATAALMLALVPAASAAPPTKGDTYKEIGLTFTSATSTFTFSVVKARDAGDLTVDTKDCCIVGDFWKVELVPGQPASVGVSATGDGSISAFSGAATAHPWVRGTVVVSYAGGVDVFPAGMTVRFQYSKDYGVIITQLP